MCIYNTIAPIGCLIPEDGYANQDKKHVSEDQEIAFIIICISHIVYRPHPVQLRKCAFPVSKMEAYAVTLQSKSMDSTPLLIVHLSESIEKK